MNIKNIAIVGMGALGVMYGDFFTRKLGKDNVTFIADKNRIDKFKADGAICNGIPCDFTITDESETGEPADLLIFAVKATGLSDAIHTVRNKIASNTIIISVLNGISSEELIGLTYGSEKVIHSVVQGMDATKIGNAVTYTQFGHFFIGIDKQSKKQKLMDVAALFDRVEMPYSIENDIIRRMWSKFMLNVGVNQAVMIHAGTYGTVQTPGDARELMQHAMKEVMVLAEKEHIEVTTEDFDGYVKLIDTMNPKGMPSMRQDGLVKRKSEVELFAGTVISLAKKHNIDVPVNKMIYETIVKIESEY